MFRPTNAVILVLAFVACAAAQTTRPAEPPTRISVDAPDARLEVALDRLSTATGVRMSMQVGGPKSERKVSLNHQNAPMLEVLADFMRQAPATPTPHGSAMAFRFYPYEAWKYELIEPTVLVIHKMIALEAVAPVDPGAKPSYSYTMQLMLIFDPSRQIVAVSRGMGVESPSIPNLTPQQRLGFGAASPDTIDARRLGVFEVDVRFTTHERLERIDRLTLRLRAWQAIERTDLSFDFDQINAGARKESHGVVADLQPLSPEGSITFKLSGPGIKAFSDYPWRQALTSALRTDNPDVPFDDMAAQTRSSAQGLDLVLGLNQTRDRDLLEMLTQISLSIPTKVRVIDIPIELRDVTLPQ